MSFSALQRAENSSMAHPRCRCGVRLGFSALQRAENSSIFVAYNQTLRCNEFQCSSASRKFLNGLGDEYLYKNGFCFSALQRAENSSITMTISAIVINIKFQCSSASRKFLNRARGAVGDPRREVSVLFSEPKIPQFGRAGARAGRRGSFSALQRAENSSIIHHFHVGAAGVCGFQCSSASRKFLNNSVTRLRARRRLGSVLFSEPKIPQ